MKAAVGDGRCNRCTVHPITAERVSFKTSNYLMMNNLK